MMDPSSLYKNLQLNRMSLVRLSFELGMAVSDYNCGITTDHSAIIRATFMYLDKVKVTDLTEDELVECYAIIGQMWASVIEKDPSSVAPVVPSSLTSPAPVVPAPVKATASAVPAPVKAAAPAKAAAPVVPAPAKAASAQPSSLAKVLSTISTITTS